MGLSDFCRTLEPSYESAKHTRLLCSHLEAIQRRDITRLMVFLPPRHSKSLHVSEMFPAWYLGLNPSHQIVLSSYGAELAEHFSRKARNRMLDERYPFSTRVAGGSSAVNHWSTDAGGTVVAAGVGGGITGFGADLLVIDDPVKDREEAESEVVREKVWDWFSDVARTRLMPRGAIAVCMTRWHQDDLAGRILDGPRAKDWTVLNLPAFAEENDALGRKVGEPLWPEWYGTDALLDLQADMKNPRNFDALYQQRPSSVEGAMFKRSWWKFYDLPDLQRQGLVPRYTVVDSAYKEGVQNDRSCAATWGALNGRFYLMHLWKDKVDYPTLKRQIRQICLTKHTTALIEDAGSGRILHQELQRAEGRHPATPSIRYQLPARVSKLDRAGAEAVTDAVQGGIVYLPGRSLSDCPGWVKEFIEEHAAFPNGRYDDQVDTTAMALTFMRRGVALASLIGNSADIKVGGQPTMSSPARQLREDDKNFWKGL